MGLEFPILSPEERYFLGFWSLFMRPERIARNAIAVRPSTLLRFHQYLVDRKYRALFTPKKRGKPGPKGPSEELIQAIVELKSHWVLVVMDQYTRRIIGFAVHVGAVDGAGLCRMFNQIRGSSVPPRYLSSDNDPLFTYHRWQANLRILETTEVKTVPLTPVSHPFVERLIGTVRREYLDHVLFWTAADLERKLAEFQRYYNAERVHASLGGVTPVEFDNDFKPRRANLSDFKWKSHCRGMVELPIAA